MTKPEALLQLLDSIGEFIEYWGFKRIHGRVWGLIYLSAEPVSTPEIVATLGVSKGLVSIAINELIEHELIYPGAKKAHGAQTYEAAEDVAKVIRNVLRNRELQMIMRTLIRIDSLRSLSDPELVDSNIASARLEELRSLTIGSRELLEAALKKDLGSIADWLKFLRIAAQLYKK